MWILNRYELCPGDVVLESGGGPFSRAIQHWTKSRFTHALIWIGNSQFVEAVPMGAISISFNLVTFPHPDAVVVLRHPGPAVGSLAAEQARNLAHKPYNRGDVARFPIAKHFTSPARSTELFCSQLVVEAYRRAGVTLVQGLAPWRVDPGKLISDSTLVQVRPTPVMELAKEEISRLGICYDRHRYYKRTVPYKSLRLTAKVVSRLRPRFKSLADPPNNIFEMLVALGAYPSQLDDKLSSDLRSLLEAEGFFALFDEAAANALRLQSATNDEVNAWIAEAGRLRGISGEYRSLAAPLVDPLWDWMADGYEYAASLLDKVVAHHSPPPTPAQAVASPLAK
jgi:hypothetical protein